MGKRLLAIDVNGRAHEHAVADDRLLLDYLREDVGLTGTKRGCDGGECGACTVLIDGASALACITLALRCAGRRVETIEGVAHAGRMSRLQRAFHECLGTQCGFCTPGMIMAAEALLRRDPAPTDDEIREALSGNLCRCTGYVKILESVRAAAAADAADVPSCGSPGARCACASGATR
jgi:4-hydroxybenzoyl-CoA reductase subunit gamma